MKKRHLGKGGLEVSAMGLGCFSMVGEIAYGRADDRESMATIRRALDLGLNLFDTSDSSGYGSNEELLGRALKGRRQEAIVATKFGAYRRDGQSVINGRPEFIKECCDASLKRLGMDYIDLYYQHRVDPHTPIEETVGGLADLIKAGKVRHIGLSEASAQTLRRANSVYPLTALQTEYSLWSRDVEKEILPTCRDLGIGFVAYAPLGRGFLVGGIKNEASLGPKDRRHLYPRFQGENLRENLKVAEKLAEIARSKGCTPAQLALAWLLSRDVVPIPGTKSLVHLEENVKALEVKVTEADAEKLEGIASLVVGARYSETMLKNTNL